MVDHQGRAVGPSDLDAQHHALLDVVVSGQRPTDSRACLVGLDGGQVTQLAVVHAQHGYRPAVQKVDGP